MYSPHAPFWFTTSLLFSVLLLQGCDTVADNQAAAQRLSDAREQHSRALAQQINQRCAGYGFQPGTTAFAQCLQKEAHQAEAIDQGQTMLMMQATQQSARDQQEHFRRARCYATGRLDCL
jgi:hypothetical protein